MDKTLEIIIAATVILLTAGLIMFMVSGQSGDFQSWLNNTQGDAECSLKKTQYENACDCGSDNPGNQEAQNIKSNVQNQCDWTDQINDCEAACN
ncbi:hypothetical protein AQV86_05795 [Nanohaloarchaea archaeon SG9]|nr:hypothetical protein AQV86_05795 [Nanohaloarchaea archaeon SG9]